MQNINMWIILSFLSAFSLASSDALLKRALRYDNEYLLAWLRFLIALPLLFILIMVIPRPELDSTFYIAFFCGIPLEILAMVLYVKALRVSPLSLTLPFLSLTPLFLILFSRIIVSEKVSLMGGIGIVLVVLGGYSLNVSSVSKGFLEPVRAIGRERGVVYMIIVAMIYSITSSLGKVAIEHSSPIFFGATYFTAVTICFTPLVFKNVKLSSYKEVIKDLSLPVVLSGAFFSIMIISHMFAVSMAKVAYMISIKRSSLLIGTIYGFIFFGERNILQRLVGASLMFAGFVLIVTSS